MHPGPIMLASSFVVHDPNRLFLPRQASGAEESCDDRAWGAIMDVGGWLRRLGLGQYEAVFRDETIFPKANGRGRGTGAASSTRRLIGTSRMLQWIGIHGREYLQ
jgi:hypothetical protein